jgi:hypothetical protein
LNEKLTESSLDNQLGVSMSDTQILAKPTAKSKFSGRRVLQIAGMILSGLAIGWIVGLAASPVLHLVVSTMITLIAGVASLLVGMDLSKQPNQSEAISDKPRELTMSHLKRSRIDSLPMAVLLVGMATGASIGVLARANEWLGANPDIIVNKWSSTGYSKEEISRRVFDDIYPTASNRLSNPVASPTVALSTVDLSSPTPSSTALPDKKESLRGSNTSSVHSGILYVANEKECGRFLAADHGEDLRREMESSVDSRIRKFAQNCRDDKVLETVMKGLLCSQSP